MAQTEAQAAGRPRAQAFSAFLQVLGIGHQHGGGDFVDDAVQKLQPFAGCANGPVEQARVLQHGVAGKVAQLQAPGDEGFALVLDFFELGRPVAHEVDDHFGAPPGPGGFDKPDGQQAQAGVPAADPGAGDAVREVASELDYELEVAAVIGVECADLATGPDSAIVEFLARFRVGGRAQRLHERSRFVRETGHWYYVAGDML